MGVVRGNAISIGSKPILCAAPNRHVQAKECTPRLMCVVPRVRIAVFCLTENQHAVRSEVRAVMVLVVALMFVVNVKTVVVLQALVPIPTNHSIPL